MRSKAGLPRTSNCSSTSCLWPSSSPCWIRNLTGIVAGSNSLSEEISFCEAKRRREETRVIDVVSLGTSAIGRKTWQPTCTLSGM